MYAENTGQVEEFITILKKRKWQIALPAVFILALSMVLALIIPGKYVIESKLELRRQRVNIDDEVVGPRTTEISDEAPNAADHLTSYERVRKVIQGLEWDEYANLRDPVLRREYIKNQVKAIDAVAPAESKLNRSLFVRLSYKHVDPEKGVAFVNALVDSWVEDLTTRDARALTAERDDEQNNVERLQKQYREAAQEVDRIEKQMRLTAVDRQNNPNFERSADRYETAMGNLMTALQDNDVARAGVEGELAELTELLRTMEDEVAKTVSGRPSNRAATIAGYESEIDNLKAQQIGLTPLHSRFKRLQSRIELLEEKIYQEANSTEAVLTTTESVPNQEKIVAENRKSVLELQLSKLVAEHDKLILREQELSSVTDERLRLSSDYDEAKNDRDVYREQLNEARHKLNAKESMLAAQLRANKTPFQWTKRPTAPPDPTEPNPFLIIALGLVGGLAVGLGSSVIVEFSKNCYRNVGDVTAVMTLPVLGVVNEIVTSQERRAMRFRAGVMVSSSVLMLTVIGWFTWAYTRNQELLPTTVLIQLEEFRNQFE